MPSLRLVLLPALTLCLGGAGGYWLGKRHASPAPGSASSPAAAGTLRPPQLAGGEKQNAGPVSTAPVTPSGDPVSDFRKILRMRDPASRQTSLDALLASIPIAELPLFLSNLEKNLGDLDADDPGAQMAALSAFEVISLHITNRDPEAYLNSSLLDKEHRNSGMADKVLQLWANRDLTGALGYYETKLRTGDKDIAKGASSVLAREYVKMDPEGAFRWITQLPETDRAEANHDAFQTLSHMKPVKAAELLVDVKELPNREEIAGALAKGWAPTEPEKALKWAAGLPADLSPDAVSAAVGVWAGKDFDKALAAVNALPDKTRDSAWQGLATNADPAELPALANLLQSQPEGEGRADGASSLASRWAAADEAAASAWVASLPAGLTHDHAAGGLAGSLLEKDPAAALDWTSAISKDESRAAHLDENLAKWFEKDPVAARTWVNQSPRLTDPDRQRLIIRTGR